MDQVLDNIEDTHSAENATAAGALASNVNSLDLNAKQDEAMEDPPVKAPAETPAETSIHTPVETSVETPVKTPPETHVESPAKTSVESPVETHVETPVETSVETPIETPAKTHVEIPVESPAKTPVETPVETPAETPAETPEKTHVEIPVESPAKILAKTPEKTLAETHVKTPVETPVESPAETAVETPEETPSDDGFVHIDSSSSQKDTAMKALSSIIKSEQPQASIDGDWVALSSPALKVHALGESTPSTDSSTENSLHADDVAQNRVESRIISYNQLKTTSTDPALNIDPTKRESYLLDAEFESLFGITKTQFYALPKWKQAQLKLNLNLF